MSTVVSFDEAWAHRITERIRYSAMAVRDGVDKLQRLVSEAQEGDAHTLLGYASWTAYIADVMGDEPLRLNGREERRELVAWLSGQGMSTRAIAPIVGVSNFTVSKDVQASAGVSDLTPEPAEPPVDEEHTDWANPVIGEVTDSPTVTEHTITEKTKTVTGLDGKTYTRPAPTKPKRRSLVDDAVTANRELFRAIERVRDIRRDDRYTRNKADILAALQPSVDLVQEILADL